MLAEALYDHLTAASGVSGITTRIYPQIVPQNVTPPMVIYQFISEEVSLKFEGQSGYRQAVVQFDCYSSRYLEAVQLASAVESALVNFRGIMGTTSPAVDVDHVRLETRSSDLFETDTELHRVSMDFLIGYE